MFPDIGGAFNAVAGGIGDVIDVVEDGISDGVDAVVDAGNWVGGIVVGGFGSLHDAVFGCPDVGSEGGGVIDVICDKPGAGDSQSEPNMGKFNEFMMKSQMMQQAASQHLKAGNEMISNILKANDQAVDEVARAVSQSAG